MCWMLSSYGFCCKSPVLIHRGDNDTELVSKSSSVYWNVIYRLVLLLLVKFQLHGTTQVFSTVVYNRILSLLQTEPPYFQMLLVWRLNLKNSLFITRMFKV